MKTPPEQLRICIHAKDIAIITGFSDRYARKIIKAIKIRNQKQDYQLVNVQEVAIYLGIEEEEIRKRMY